MAVVAIATLVHALVTTTRRQRRDLAVLRTVGFTRRQVQSVVAWQATALVLAAALVAVPVGIVLGRWAWLIFADELRVVGRPVVPALAVIGATLGALVMANVVAGGHRLPVGPRVGSDPPCRRVTAESWL